MEEYDLFTRARVIAPVHIMKHKKILVSARKFNDNSYLKVNWANLIAVIMFIKGKPPGAIRRRYASMLTQRIARY
jgi:hypothetical protein